MSGIFDLHFFPGLDFASWYVHVIRVAGRPGLGSEHSPTIGLRHPFGHTSWQYEGKIQFQGRAVRLFSLVFGSI
jgi:hypothetical protein